MDTTKSFFEALVADICKVYTQVHETSSSRDYDEGWNAAVQACLIRIYQFFGRTLHMPKEHDPVNHPSYYNSGNIEVIEFIEDQGLSYHLGCALKYICRAGKKDPTKTVEDLRKAEWYIHRAIDLDKGEACS